MSDLKLQDVLDEMKKTTEALHGYVDRKIEEVRKTGGNGDPLTLESIEKANKDIDELRKHYDELLVLSKRPAADAADNSAPEAMLLRSAFSKFMRYGSGENSAAQLTLYALSDISDKTTININLLTHLERERLKELVKQGEKYASAVRVL